jgi:hypothetical protein
MAGMPIWYELMSPDPAGVAPFYKAVIGWEIPAKGNPMPNGSEYREIARASGGWQGGVLTLTPQMAEHGVQPAWLTYFDVVDVDATVEAVVAAGGQVFMPGMTMEGIGRMAMVADPQGAPFYVMKPTPPADQPDAQSDVFKSDAVGHCAWNELNTNAAAEQMAFYTALFDWHESGEMPMPDGHTYKFLERDGRGMGAIGSMKPEGFTNAWLPYFRVAEIGAAYAAALAHGGSVMMGPMPVPGDDHIIVARDPAGAMAGFVGKASS